MADPIGGNNFHGINAIIDEGNSIYGSEASVVSTTGARVTADTMQELYDRISRNIEHNIIYGNSFTQMNPTYRVSSWNTTPTRIQNNIYLLEDESIGNAIQRTVDSSINMNYDSVRISPMRFSQILETNLWTSPPSSGLDRVTMHTSLGQIEIISDTSVPDNMAYFVRENGASIPDWTFTYTPETAHCRVRYQSHGFADIILAADPGSFAPGVWAGTEGVRVRIESGPSLYTNLVLNRVDLSERLFYLTGSPEYIQSLANHFEDLRLNATDGFVPYADLYDQATVQAPTVAVPENSRYADITRFHIPSSRIRNNYSALAEPVNGNPSQPIHIILSSVEMDMCDTLGNCEDAQRIIAKVKFTHIHGKTFTFSYDDGIELDSGYQPVNAWEIIDD